MSIKFYVNQSGQFLGVYADGAVPPQGSIETPTGPTDGRQYWGGASWRYSKSTLKDLAKAKRFEVETAGTLLWGSVPIQTDRESQALITGAYNTLQRNPAALLHWSTAEGFVTLGQAEVNALADAASLHVQNAFAAEAAITPLINNGTIKSLEDVYNWQGWNI